MSERRVLAVLSLAAFVVMADTWVVSPILPAIARDLNVNVASAALIISTYMLPFGLFQLLFGYLGDRFGRVRVISTAMVFFTIGAALCTVASSLTSLAIYRALTGAFAGAVMPVSFALIGDLFPLEKRQAAIGAFFGTAFMGQGLSMVIGGSVAHYLSWRGVFAAYAALALISTVLLYACRKSAPAVQNRDSRLFAPLASLLSRPASRGVYLIVFFEGALIMGSFSFLGAFIESRYRLGNLAIGLIMSAFGVMAVVGGRISGRISGVVGRRAAIAIGFGFAALAQAIYATGGRLLPALILGVGLCGLGLTLAHSSILTLATEFAAKARGVAMSLVAFCYMFGGSVGTAIGSRVVRTEGFVALFVAYGLGLLLLLVGALGIVKSPAIESPAAPQS